jgi:anaerobic magnesium-protoporphyrin IX monomethyl ester cyclase
MEDSHTKIAVVHPINSLRNLVINKDLNGGLGTADSYAEHSILERMIGYAKRRNVIIPVTSLIYLMGILKSRGFEAHYYEKRLPEDKYDIVLIYASIVDYKYENRVCFELKNKFPNSKIGFIGPFPSILPELFDIGDFIVKGDFEYFFHHVFKDPSQLSGIVPVKEKVNLDDLPSPELCGFPLSEYSYSPMIDKKPFVTLRSSYGCPYSCAYYCAYGKYQGSQVNVRSVPRLVGDIEYIQEKWGIRGIQFRDPVFGIKKGYIEEFCDSILKKGIKIDWGIETRSELLSLEKLKLMFDAGLRNINLGVETVNKDIAQMNKRSVSNIQGVEQLVNQANRIGIKITPFYMFAYENDTIESMNRTLAFSKKLNTLLARFAVFTPYPGTQYFEDLEKKGRIMTHDYESYTQFELVFKHINLSSSDVRKMLTRSYVSYYFRPKYFFTFMRWKIRDFF